MAGPTIEIQPPVRAARAGGISSVATFRLNDRLGAAAALTFQSAGCDFPQISQHLCYAGAVDPDDKTFDGIDSLNAIGVPFPLYAGVQCFVGPNPDELERAERALDEGQDRLLEAALIEWAAAGTALEAGSGVGGAIGKVDQALDDTYIGQGVILISREDAVRASDLLIREGNTIRTINGTPVLASGRIEPGSVYGVGAIAVEHSVAQSYEATDHESNTHWALAEQIFAIAVDCNFRVASEITETGGGGVDPETLQRITDLETETAALTTTVTDVQTELAGKADTVHTHAAADVTSGIFAIARIPTGTTATTVALGNHTHTAAAVGAAPTVHTHTVAQVTGLQAELDGKVESVVAGTGIAVDNTDPANPIVATA